MMTHKFTLDSPIQCLDSTVCVWQEAKIKEINGKNFLIHYTEKYTSNKFDNSVTEGKFKIY